ARAANLYGCPRSFLGTPLNEARDIDILFVGNFNPAIQSDRLPWLARLARLGDRYRVQIRTGVFGEDYRKILGRARIVFNRSIRGEANQRTFEAAAAGTLLFQETENQEAHAYFRDRQECVYYTSENLEQLLEYYLEHEDERQAIASAGRARVADFTADKLWDRQLELIDGEWPGMVEHANIRPRSDGSDELLTRTWQLLCATSSDDSTLLTDLTHAAA